MFRFLRTMSHKALKVETNIKKTQKKEKLGRISECTTKTSLTDDKIRVNASIV